MSELRQFLLDALREMNYDVTGVTDDTPLGPTGLDLESLAIAELALRLEDAYQLRIDDDETERIAVMTVGEFAATVSDRITSSTPGRLAG